MTHRSTFAIPPLARAAVAFTLAAALAAPAAAQEYRLGIVTFLSGGAAGPFGIPARNAAELVIDTLNAGKLPAPYNTKGIAGRQIAPIVIDEAGGASKQVTEYRNLRVFTKTELRRKLRWSEDQIFDHQYEAMLPEAVDDHIAY